MPSARAPPEIQLFQFALKLRKIKTLKAANKLQTTNEMKSLETEN